MTRSSGYSEAELLKMQEDAIARVRQMQERARRNLGEVQGQDPEPELVQPEVIPPASSTGPAQQRNNNATNNTNSNTAQSLLPSLGNLSNLFSASGNSPISTLLSWAGGDRIIILVLIVILLGDNADQTLLLALCYLLLFD